MAEKTEQDEQMEEAKRGGFLRGMLKFFGVLLLLFLIVVAGFFAGIYLRVFDVYEMNRQVDLYAMPFIGEYFVKPAISAKEMIAEKISKMNEPPPEPENVEGEKTAGDGKKDEKKDEKKDDQPKPIKKEEESKPVVLTQEEIEKRQKAEEAAERKRVSKLAKLYNEMKPEAAADIMTDLDDEIAVAVLQKMDESQAAKVLASLDPGHSARLTRSIYTGRRSSMASPGDQIVPVPQEE
jgi:flagellar motility protein MotE (MotC chaperone)